MPLLSSRSACRAFCEGKALMFVVPSQGRSSAFVAA